VILDFSNRISRDGPLSSLPSSSFDVTIAHSSFSVPRLPRHHLTNARFVSHDQGEENERSRDRKFEGGEPLLEGQRSWSGDGELSRFE